MTEQEEKREQDDPVSQDDGTSMEDLERAAEAAAAAGDDRIRQALEEKSREATEAQEKYLRTYADFENYRKRMQRDLADFRKYANEQMALELLPVADHLGLAILHAREAGAANDALMQGVELVYKQFRDVFEKFGVKPFKAEGEPFDPSKHDAMMQVETADAPENTVVQVLQEGYLYHEKVLRHAKVGVAKKPAAKEESTA